VLFDEIEKAHPEVFNVLLQVLDDGRLTDGQGRTVDFRNTVIIMTSNLGSQWIRELDAGDYARMKSMVMETLKESFKPEFLNRIDEIVIYQPFRSSRSRKSSDQVQGLVARLAERRIGLRSATRPASTWRRRGTSPPWEPAPEADPAAESPRPSGDHDPGGKFAEGTRCWSTFPSREGLHQKKYYRLLYGNSSGGAPRDNNIRGMGSSIRTGSRTPKLTE
jgi:hypothetical protein